MKLLVGMAIGAVVVGTFACSANTPIGPDAGPVSGIGGTFGAAGTTGVAGTGTVTSIAGTTGAAGTGFLTGIAGTTGAAGTGFLTGIAGISGAAAIGGSAGSSAVGCSSFSDPTLATGKCAAGAFRRNGVCQCQATTPLVCGEQCVDIFNDDNNCGCCGRACGPGSACNQGRCGPSPLLLVPASPGCQSMELAVSGGTLYWTDKGHGRVASMPTSGGVGTIIAGGQATPTTIAVNGTTVYWQLPAAILRSVQGGPPQTVVVSPSLIHGFAVSADGAWVYYSTDTVVMSTPAAGGGTPLVVAREEHGGLPTALALDGKILAYPTDVNGDVDVIFLNEGKVASCGKETSNGEVLNVDCQRVARSQGSLFREKIIAQQGLVIWVDGATLKMGPTVVAPFPMNDAIASTLFENITGFATLGSVVYFSDGTSDTDASGTIYKAPLAPNQTAIRLARGQRHPRAVVVDKERVYWSTADCTIMTTGL